ncbi:hypothetical protein FLO80_04305 [Aquicoccus porphyridii]|uniref:PaaX family transcriptional regulator n=2 Tax=Aquicoccus porphyridii TaxID=1852029 RepID=A0A5A9ZT99_9RHOB|nr:hypothetical protein FLO80_04305 [Aquicoccus porphyridii]RAI54867.1 hypothetical protein DOO74_06475 [Rhodobacteraceae bacterium AsT-22]
MEDRPPLDPPPAMSALLECGTLKTWSVIVTILGDLAGAPEAHVPGPVLSALTERMGLRGQAMRVALHRLRRDGWITSSRDGRASRYMLTGHGLALTLSVSDQVYGAAPPAPQGWRIVLAPSGEAMTALDHPDAILIAPRVALLPEGTGPNGAEDVPAPLLAWDVAPGAVPGWLGETLAPPDITHAYARLTRALALAAEVPLPPSPLDRAALRVLALHQWRRLVLRHGPGPEALMGAQWPGAKARSGLTRVMQIIPRPDPCALAESL